MARYKVFDLEKHFAFYGAYHSNPINIAIHMIFVWPIFFSAALIIYFAPPLFNIPPVYLSLSGHDLILVMNIGSVLTLIYMVFYTCLDVKGAGSMSAFICLFCWVVSSYLASRLGFSLAWKVVLVTQLVCWTGQFIGHGVFEKRAPALLDNIFQAFIMAPFFVTLEALHLLYGYEPYPGFYGKVQDMMEAEGLVHRDKRQNLLL